jgi:hypothetical protein
MTASKGTDPKKSFDMLRRVHASDLPRDQHAVLLALLIYARPDLTVYHSEAALARACRYTETTIRAALKALLAAHLLRVIKGHHPGHATEYQIDLRPLGYDPDLADGEVDPAVEARAETSQQTDNHLRFETDNDCRFTPQTGNGLPQTVNHLPPRGSKEKIKKNFLAHAHDTKRPRPAHTPAPDYLHVSPDFITWFTHEVPGLDLGQEREAFLGYCRRHTIENPNWEGAFKDWCLKAYARWQRGEPTASYPQPGRQPAAVSTSTGVSAGRVTCSYDGCDAPPCPHGQACAHHACCAACAAEAGTPATELDTARVVEEAPTPSVLDTPVDPPAREPLLEPPETAPPAAVQALVQGFLTGHAMPPATPTPRPLGSLPPERRTVLGHLRALWGEEDQPTYRAVLAQRRAREGQAPPAMAVEEDPP